MPNPTRVLVCEDDDGIRTLVEVLLRRRGFIVEPVKNGRAAIEVLFQDDFDLIVLDLLMPVVGGYEVLSFLRGTRPDLLDRVVVLTAFPNAFREPLPIAAVVRKPFDIEELNAVLDGVMNRKRTDEWSPPPAILGSP
ncbi:MAG TPA: response regulator [Thermoanaerobaculia bacterium]|nr:response regulator [Thermoanaerobaculia bacterium]